MFERLIIWNDRDHDGVSSEDELQSLAYAGVTWIDLAAVVRKVTTDTYGNVFTAATFAFRTDGSKLQLSTVKFRSL